MNILIIEDDVFLAGRMKETFEKKIISNRIQIVYTYQQFCKELINILSYDIVLVDIILERNSNKNGIDIVKDIRAKSKKIPIVMVTGHDDISWLEKSFSQGANDYIVKPFRLKELELRVFKWFETYFYMDLSGKNKIQYEGLEYDIKNNEFYFQNKKIQLTKGSKYLLSLFLSKPGELITERKLIEKIWGDLDSCMERNLRVNIMRLKTALQPYFIDDWIENVRGEGYRIIKKNF